MYFFTLEPDTYRQGTPINQFNSISWVERFQDGGEFSIELEPTSDNLNQLDLGTFVSHTATKEVMVVEDIYIETEKYNDPVATISGRSAEVVALENRLAVMSVTGFSASRTSLYYYPFKYSTAYNYGWIHIRDLLEDSVESSLLSSSENLPNFTFTNLVNTASYGGPYEGALPSLRYREFTGLKTIYSCVHEIMKFLNAGMKTQRPVRGETNLQFILHRGDMKVSTVRFDWRQGDLDSARYLRSIRKEKNCGYLETAKDGIRVRSTTATGWDLKILGVQDTDLDLEATWNTGGSQIARARINHALADTKQNNILDAKISPETEYKYGYNQDYDIGDVVWVHGNYGYDQAMRVSEYALTVDRNGTFGIPTLTSDIEPPPDYATD